VTQRDEKEQRQQKPLFLLAVGCNAEIAAICDDAVGSLEGIGFRGFTDPDEAIVWAKDHGLLGVVIDNEMPRMDGAAFLRRLPVVADQPRPHIILLTEGAADEVPAAARKAGIDDIVVKPVPRADFAAFLASALALRFDEQMGWQPDPLRPPVADVPPPSLPPPIVPPLPPPPAPPEPASSRRRAVLWLAIALLLSSRRNWCRCGRGSHDRRLPRAGYAAGRGTLRQRPYGCRDICTGRFTNATAVVDNAQHERSGTRQSTGRRVAAFSGGKRFPRDRLRSAAGRRIRPR
jgi:DNA-binding NarL/FixJ family response regulator